MKIERTKNTVKNIGFGVVSRIVGMILPFASRTVILYVLGAKYLGLSSLFSSILSFLALSELGIGAAMVYSMYKPIAENDNDTICALLNLYKKLYRMIGTVIMALGLGLLPFLKVIIPDELPEGVNLYVLYIIYLLNTVLSYWLFAYKNAVIQAYHKSYLTTIVGTMIPIASYAVMLPCLILTKNYYAYVIWLPVFTVLQNVLTALIVNKNFPDIRPRGSVDKELKISIAKKVSALIGTKLNTVVLSAADNIVMSVFLGLTVIAMYGNYYAVFTMVTGFLGIAYGSMTAGIGNSIQIESVEKNYRDFEKLSFMNSWLVGWCTVCLVCLYQPFMKIWVGEELMFPFYVVLQFALYFYVYMIRKIPVVYKDAAGIWWEDRFRPYVCMVVNLVLNIVLVQIIGISGIILSTVFSLLVSIPWENYTIFKNVFHRSSLGYYLKMLCYGGCMALGGALTYFVCGFMGDGVLWLLAKALCCVVIPNAVFILTNFKRREFKEACTLAKRIITRKM